MHCSPARWKTIVAAAAVIALPLAASAQQTETKPDTKIDATAAKQHLSEARDTLSQLTSMPEAARLQGEARTQVSELITNFNELITTQSNWRSTYSKVDANLTSLLGPDSPEPAPAAPPTAGVAGAVGTSGSTAIQLDPPVRAKLAEFRKHLKEFERSAGGNAAGSMSPSVATATTATPANPVPPADPPATSVVPADQAKPAGGVAAADADKHLDAISAILNESKTGALTKAQTEALKKHVLELKQLLHQGR